MGRREILVFVAAFVVVLLGGAALAQVGTFSSAPAGDAAAMSEHPAADELVSGTTKADKVEPPVSAAPGTTAPIDKSGDEAPQDPVPPADERNKEEPPAEE